MNQAPKDEDGNTAAHYWARGGMWFLILLGFGGCCALAELKITFTDNPKVETSK